MTMIAIVDYGLGNLFSVRNAFDAIGAPAEVTADPEKIAAASRIVLPGVGAFGDGMDMLRKRGLVDALTVAVIKNKVPFLGICLGLQFLADSSEEYGTHAGLGWIKGDVRKIDIGSSGMKLPHIGWNTVSLKSDVPLFAGIRQNAEFYFLHTYQLHCSSEEDVVATTDYGERITAALMHKNIFATQFHPEKSQDSGLRLLRNFTVWQP